MVKKWLNKHHFKSSVLTKTWRCWSKEQLPLADFRHSTVCALTFHGREHAWERIQIHTYIHTYTHTHTHSHAHFRGDTTKSHWNYTQGTWSMKLYTAHWIEESPQTSRDTVRDMFTPMASPETRRVTTISVNCWTYIHTAIGADTYIHSKYVQPWGSLWEERCAAGKRSDKDISQLHVSEQ